MAREKILKIPLKNIYQLVLTKKETRSFSHLHIVALDWSVEEATS